MSSGGFPCHLPPATCDLLPSAIILRCENGWNTRQCGCCSRRLGRCRGRWRDSLAHARRRFYSGCGRDCARAAAENLKLAFPEWRKKQRRAAIRGMVRQLGWMAAEFAHFPSYTKKNIDRIVLLDGFENFAVGAGARQRGSVSHRPHERVGTGSVRPGALRKSTAFSGAAHRQSTSRRAHHEISLPERESADRQKSVGARGFKGFEGKARWGSWPIRTR